MLSNIFWVMIILLLVIASKVKNLNKHNEF